MMDDISIELLSDYYDRECEHQMSLNALRARGFAPSIPSRDCHPLHPSQSQPDNFTHTHDIRSPIGLLA